MMTPAELAAAMKAEITELVAAGTIPADARDFAHLHDFVDANTLGGTEALWDALPVNEAGDVDAGDLCDLMNAATAEVDEWIKAGGLRGELVTA